MHLEKQSKIRAYSVRIRDRVGPFQGCFNLDIVLESMIEIGLLGL